ncbi:MAG: hypothetical protein ACE5G3_09125 [Gammaproteobacteria bacterium]
MSARAEDGSGPDYTHIGVGYEWTDVKFGVKPSTDERFNNGTMEGLNVDASFGLLPWLHVAGQYFDGDCDNCGTNPDGSFFSQDFSGYKIGLGVNVGFDTFGLNDRTDFVVRGHYIDVEHKKLNVDSGSGLSGDGWSAEGVIRSQISPRADFEVGYAYQDVSPVTNTDVIIGLNYRIGWDVALLARGNIFDDDTGFELGVRWYFGDALLDGRDSIVR